MSASPTRSLPLVLVLACAAPLASFVPASAIAAAQADPREAELVPVVQAGFANTDVSVQAWAVRAAALLKDRTLQGQVTAALANPNPRVRIAAAVALISTQNRAKLREAEQVLARELVANDATARAQILEGFLPRFAEASRKNVLERALAETSDANIKGALIAYAARGNDAALLSLLDRFTQLNDPADRAVYLRELQKVAHPGLLRFAQALIRSRDAVRQAEGASLAIAINTVEARTALEPVLRSSDAALAQRVGFHLARYGNNAAAALVRDLALNATADEPTRIEAIGLLRDSAPTAIDFTKFKDLLQEQGRTTEFSRVVYEALGASRGTESVVFLDGLVNGKFAADRLNGMYGIGYSGRPEVVPVLEAELKGHGEMNLRLAGARGLGHIGGSEAAQALIRQLRAERVDAVKVEIVKALGDAGSTDAAEPLCYLFSQQNEALSIAAIDALVKLNAAGITDQLEVVAGTARSPLVRWKATIAMVRLDPEVGRVRLLQALDRPPESFMTDIAGLSRELQDEVDDNLVQSPNAELAEAALFRILKRADGGYSVLRNYVLQAPSATLRRTAISVVTAAGKPEDLDAFKRLSEQNDRAVRLQGFAAIAELADPANEAFLKGYINHADEAMRVIAAYGILRVPPPAPPPRTRARR